MKKKLFSLLLVVCMIVGMLPMIALADDAAAPEAKFSFLLPGKGYQDLSSRRYITMNAGTATFYFLTVDGFIAEGASASNYNVKIEYPTGGVPTLYLKDAVMNNDDGIVFGFSSTSGGVTTRCSCPLNIVVESDSSITTNHASGHAIIADTTGDVTISGEGKLTVSTQRSGASGAIHAVAGNLILDNADIYITDDGGVSPNRSYLICVNGGDLTVKGGKLFLETLNDVQANKAIHTPILVNADEAGNGGDLTIQDGADVKIYATPSTNNVTSYRSSTDLIDVTGEINFVDSDIEMAVTNQNRLEYYTFNKLPTLTYENGYTAEGDVYTEYSSVPRNAWDGTTLTHSGETKDYDEMTDAEKAAMTYFKIEAKDAPAGDENPPAGGENPPAGDENPPAGGENPPAGGENPPAGGDDTPIITDKQAFIQIPSIDAEGKTVLLNVIVNEGAPAKYYLTNANGKAIEAGASESNYNVKFVYPYQGTPTVYLKNAKLTNGLSAAFGIGRSASQNVAAINDFDFIIYTEADSTLEGTWNEARTAKYAAITSGVTDGHKLIISGPGKLTATSEAHYAIHTLNEVVFKDANFYGQSNIVNGEGRRATIFCDFDVTIDHSTVELDGSSGPVINLGTAVNQLTSEKDNNLTIINGSNVKIDNTRSNAARAVLELKGDVIIDNSSVEIIGQNKIFNEKPVLKNVSALGGTKASNAVEYNEKKALSYYYFKTTAAGGTVSGGTTGGTTGGSTSNPATGDSMNMILWFSLLGVSAAGFVTVMVYNKKRAYK